MDNSALLQFRHALDVAPDGRKRPWKRGGATRDTASKANGNFSPAAPTSTGEVPPHQHVDTVTNQEEAKSSRKCMCAKAL